MNRILGAGMGMTIPAGYGGRGLTFLDAALVVEEMARGCGVTGRIVVEGNMGAISAIMKYGSEDQKRLAAESVLAGDKPAICITEPEAGSAASQMSTRADKHGDRYVINGKKHWITGGGVSKLHLIFARVFENGEEQGIGGFIAFRDRDKGLRIGCRERAMGLRGIPETEILFEDLELGEDRLIEPGHHSGGPGQDLRLRVRHQDYQPRPADLRGRGLLPRSAPGTHGAQRPHVHHRRRHRPDPAHRRRDAHPRPQAAADTRRLRRDAQRVGPSRKNNPCRAAGHGHAATGRATAAGDGVAGYPARRAMDIPDARQRVYNPCLPIPAAAIPTNDTRAGRVAV